MPFFRILRYLYGVGFDRSVNLILPLKKCAMVIFDNEKQNTKKMNRKDFGFVDIQGIF